MWPSMSTLVSVCVCENTSVCVLHCTCVGAILAGMHKLVMSEWLTRGSLEWEGEREREKERERERKKERKSE